MNERERAILVIKDYTFDFQEPRLGMLKNQFAKSSYSLWAANELIMLIKKNKTMRPIEVVQKFAAQMAKYSHMHRDADIAFETAHFVAANILEVFRAME